VNEIVNDSDSDTDDTYLLTPWCRVLLEKLTGFQLVKKFPAFHGTRRFITALTSVRHLSLSWVSPIQSIYPHPTSWGSILLLSTHLRLGLPSGLLPSGFPTKTLYTPLSLAIRATCPAHLRYIDTDNIPEFSGSEESEYESANESNNDSNISIPGPSRRQIYVTPTTGFSKNDPHPRIPPFIGNPGVQFAVENEAGVMSYFDHYIPT